MIKFETHLHTKGGSGCAHVTMDEVKEIYSKAGYQALCITNHYSKACFDEYPGETKEQKLDYYFSLVDDLISKVKPLGIKVFWGMEVRAKRDDGIQQEFMIYPKDKSIAYDNPPLFNLYQKELFDLCNKYGCFMFQTHPFRDGIATGEAKYLHGVEGYNGHYHHNSHNDLAMEFAKKNNLKYLAGSDFHNNDQPVVGGIYLPENINTNAELIDYLFNNQPEIIWTK